MGIDQGPRGPERPVIQISKEDFDVLTDFAMDSGDKFLNDPRLQQLMERIGMQFDQGSVELVAEDGTHWDFVTDRKDFGTMTEIKNNAQGFSPRDPGDTLDEQWEREQRRNTGSIG